ncbi:hypothetical protein [Bartonella jaculi]|uniref:hypothetical protein n=1 Tax=Bartonella jaculi TaxID=686226 RepID=UPI0031ED7DD7
MSPCSGKFSGLYCCLYAGDAGVVHSLYASVEKNIQRLEEATWQRDKAMCIQVIGLESDKSTQC